MVGTGREQYRRGSERNGRGAEWKGGLRGGELEEMGAGGGFGRDGECAGREGKDFCIPLYFPLRYSVV